MQFFVPRSGRKLRASAVLGVTSGLQRRLLVMLIVPLVLLAGINAWFEYRSAGNVAAQQDHRLLALVPLVADSIVGDAGGRPLLMLAPPVQEFLKGHPSDSAYAISDIDGRLLHGEPWLVQDIPADAEPQFHSEEQGGVTWRIVRQRQQTIFGEVVVAVADSADPRQQWARSILFKVLLPNLVLIAAAAFAVGWAVERALRPLRSLREAVERRLPRELSAIDESASPGEVRPPVQFPNPLFGLAKPQCRRPDPPFGSLLPEPICPTPPGRPCMLNVGNLAPQDGPIFGPKEKSNLGIPSLPKQYVL